jgi:Rrf2 family transcriptional regulator, iron-sulfur cluster assembly transcription factor
MKIFSNSTIYALRALIYIVSKENEEEYTSISEISEKLEISFHFLTKSLQKLTQEGILVSSRGPAGGIALNKPAKKVRLADIVMILEGEDYFDSCMLGLPGCGEQKPCPVHDFWAGFKKGLKKELSKVTLKDLGNKTIRDRLRLTLT